jgi:hypothetical protein
VERHEERRRAMRWTTLFVGTSMVRNPEGPKGLLQALVTRTWECQYFSMKLEKVVARCCAGSAAVKQTR